MASRMKQLCETKKIQQSLATNTKEISAGNNPSGRHNKMKLANPFQIYLKTG
jgi:hypothetical protein